MSAMHYFWIYLVRMINLLVSYLTLEEFSIMLLKKKLSLSVFTRWHHCPG